MLVHARVAAGGSLVWAPEPLIAAAGCAHDAVTVVEIAGGGAVRWRDELILGRHGEEPGDVRVDTTVRYAGRTLHRHTLRVGPGPGSPAVLGGHRTYRSELVVDPARQDPGPPSAPGVLPLAGPAVLACAVGEPLPRVPDGSAPSPCRTGAREPG